MSLHPLKELTSARGARMLRTAFGPAIAAWLEDPAVVEVMLNPDGRLWVDRLTMGLAETGHRPDLGQSQLDRHGSPPMKVRLRLSRTGAGCLFSSGEAPGGQAMVGGGRQGSGGDHAYHVGLHHHVRYAHCSTLIRLPSRITGSRLGKKNKKGTLYQVCGE